MKITFLGTGTSIGVPEMLCSCAVCGSENPKDKRLRTSVLIETGTANILIDCGPDFREQVLRYKVDQIDAVLVTHEHYDHVGGMDDLRPFSFKKSLPVYAEQFVVEHLMQRIPYCFGSNKYPGTPQLELTEIEAGKIFTVGTSEILPVRVMHGKLPILGYRIGNMAFITDMKSIDDAEVTKLEGLDLLIVNALHTKEHPTHQNLMQAINFAERVGAKDAWFVHMSHRVGLHNIVDARLPKHIHLAYDGCVLNI
ncbi:MAG: MBL fold metallo-hydrolase [Bacteroidaceae bacterium]|nr:MBL fold metallo-hydrolase [Bacteroidaceae bacterium]